MRVMTTTASELRMCSCALIIAIPVSQDRETLTQRQRAASGSLNNMHSCFLLVCPSKLAYSGV